MYQERCKGVGFFEDYFTLVCQDSSKFPTEVRNIVNRDTFFLTSRLLYGFMMGVHFISAPLIIQSR